MRFSSVQFYQFRNLSNVKISLGQSREIFLVGENGQGKTNFLEALYFLCYGTSFRTKAEKKLIQNGTDGFSIFGTFVDGESHSSDVRIKFTKDHREIWLDGDLVLDRKVLIQAFPCVVFAHEDFLFVKGEPDFQRFFFDQTASMTEILYLDSLRNYRKILKSRNALLAQNTDPLLMRVWEEKLADFGLEVMESRKRCVEAMVRDFQSLFKNISGSTSEVVLNYLPSWKSSDKESVLNQLEERRLQDKELGFTSAGPHRDRFGFQIDGKSVQDMASTGQVRLMSLLLRVLQAKMTLEKTGRPPILLLDDVLLELDQPKRLRFMENLPRESQAFFTFLPDHTVGSKERVLTVQGGVVS